MKTFIEWEHKIDSLFQEKIEQVREKKKQVAETKEKKQQEKRAKTIQKSFHKNVGTWTEMRYSEGTLIRETFKGKWKDRNNIAPAFHKVLAMNNIPSLKEINQLFSAEEQEDYISLIKNQIESLTISKDYLYSFVDQEVTTREKRLESLFETSKKPIGVLIEDWEREELSELSKKCLLAFLHYVWDTESAYELYNALLDFAFHPKYKRLEDNNLEMPWGDYLEEVMSKEEATVIKSRYKEWFYSSPDKKTVETRKRLEKQIKKEIETGSVDKILHYSYLIEGSVFLQEDASELIQKAIELSWKALEKDIQKLENPSNIVSLEDKIAKRKQRIEKQYQALEKLLS